MLTATRAPRTSLIASILSASFIKLTPHQFYKLWHLYFGTKLKVPSPHRSESWNQPEPTGCAPLGRGRVDLGKSPLSIWDSSRVEGFPHPEERLKGASRRTKEPEAQRICVRNSSSSSFETASSRPPQDEEEVNSSLSNSRAYRTVTAPTHSRYPALPSAISIRTISGVSYGCAALIAASSSA